MNSKIFTLSTLLLFFLVKINAQTTHASIDNTIGVFLSVEDSPAGQKFELNSQEEYYIIPNKFISFKIDLDYQSEEETTSYFGIRYKICRLAFNGTIGEIVRGITVPVIIPPVRKKKPTSDFSSSVTRAVKYPHTIYSKYRAEESDYFVRLILVKYETRQDYLDQTDNFSEVHSVNFDLLTLNDIPAPQGETTTFAITTYPNPSIDHVTIEAVNRGTENTILHSSPIEVIIFNDKGRKMSSHSLTNLGKKNNKTSYNIDTTHLPKGMYFFQIKYGKDTLVKTIMKK